MRVGGTGNTALSGSTTALGGARLTGRARDTADRIALRFGCLNERQAVGLSPIPFSHTTKKESTHLGTLFFLEQGTGIEPASVAWEATILPMN